MHTITKTSQRTNQEVIAPQFTHIDELLAAIPARDLLSLVNQQLATFALYHANTGNDIRRITVNEFLAAKQPGSGYIL